MNVWIALWLVCTSPDKCISMQDAAAKTFESNQVCMSYAREKALILWQPLQKYPEGSIRFTCIETKEI